MWFLFGLVTFVTTVIFALKQRARSAWGGSPAMLYRDGKRLQYQHGTRTHGRKTTATIWGVVAPAGYDFGLSPEGWFDRISRRLGVNAERSVGDPEFDSAVFIDSNDERVIRALSGAPTLRARMVELTRVLPSHGFGKWSCESAGGRLWFEARGNAAPDPELTSAVVAVLHELARSLPTADEPATRRSDAFVWRALLVLSMNAGFVVLAVVTLLRSTGGRTDILDPWLMFVAMLPLGLVVAAAFFVAAARWLLRSARAHRVLAEILVVGVPAIAICIYGIARDVNMDFDAGAPSWRIVEQASTSHETYSCGRRIRRKCNRYLLHLPDGIDGEGRPRVIQLSRGQFARLPRQGTVSVDIRGGALGFPWVAGVRGP